MRFFTRITFICNLCFLAAVILRAIETSRREGGNFNGVIGFQPLESSIIILGYGAILINVVFVLMCIVLFLMRRPNPSVRWIVWFNIISLPLQVYFHFFY